MFKVGIVGSGDTHIRAGFPYLPRPGHWKALRHSSCFIVIYKHPITAEQNDIT